MLNDRQNFLPFRDEHSKLCLDKTPHRHKLLLGCIYQFHIMRTLCNVHLIYVLCISYREILTFTRYFRAVKLRVHFTANFYSLYSTRSVLHIELTDEMILS